MDIKETDCFFISIDLICHGVERIPINNSSLERCFLFFFLINLNVKYVCSIYRNDKEKTNNNKKQKGKKEEKEKKKTGKK